MKKPKSLLVWLGHRHAVQTTRSGGCGCGLGHALRSATRPRADFPRRPKAADHAVRPPRWPWPRDLRRAGRRGEKGDETAAPQADDPPAELRAGGCGDGIAADTHCTGGGRRGRKVAAGGRQSASADRRRVRLVQRKPSAQPHPRRLWNRTPGRSTAGGPDRGSRLRVAGNGPAARAAQRISAVGLRHQSDPESRTRRARSRRAPECWQRCSAQNDDYPCRHSSGVQPGGSSASRRRLGSGHSWAWPLARYGPANQSW